MQKKAEFIITMKSESKNRVTIKDIARHCGLSKSTVGYIVSNSPHYKPSQRSKELVMQAMTELNYKPNTAARSLRTNKSYAIGIILRSLYDRFYAEFAENVQSRLAELGYSGFFTFCQQDQCEKNVNYLVERGIDGCITTFSGTIPFLLENNIPTVYYTSITNFPVDHVMVNQNQIMFESVKVLYELGHRKIGYAGHTVKGNPRHEAFTKALNHFDLKYDEAIVLHHTGSYKDGAKYYDRIRQLNHKLSPTAIIAQNDPIAMGIISRANECGVRVPNDLSVIGGNNIDESKYFIPQLTTFDYPIAQISETVIKNLINRIDHPERAPENKVIDVKYIPGKSVAPVSL